MSTESDILSVLAPVGLELARLGIEAAMGRRKTKEEVARDVVRLAGQLVPRDELIAYLTEADVVRGEIAADIAEDHKFDPPPDPLDE